METMAIMVIQFNGTNDAIGDSGANGSPMMPIQIMTKMVPKATMVLILTVTVTPTIIGANEALVANGSSMSPLPFDGDLGCDIAI